MDKRIRNQIIQALVQGEKSIYSLIDGQDASLKEFFPLLQELREQGLVYVQSGRAGLTPQADEAYGFLKGWGHSGCSQCGQTGYSARDFLPRVAEQLEELLRQRPRAAEDFDQGFISLDGVLRRVAFILERGDLLESSICLVGDDDLLGAALALTGLPREVEVLEIDSRLVDYINAIASRMDLRLSARVFDVQDPLPESLAGRFDTFVTDPVETLPGLTLFLSRGVSALAGQGSSGYFGLTTLEASRDKWYAIQQRLQEMGFVITDIRRRFSLYPQQESSFASYQEKCEVFRRVGVEADTDWYTSSLYRVEAVREPRPCIREGMTLDEKVYMDEESLATPC
jgi:hypothetical protein